jgi:alkaline phosphatase
MKKVWMYLLFVCGLMLSIAYCQTPGDINGDNKVNLTEAIHALKVTAGHGSSSIEGIKYVILVIGDGMQLEHEIAASQYLNGTPDQLSFHQLPFKAHMTTWDATTYNRYAWIRGIEPYDPGTFTPGMAYDIFSAGRSPFPLDKPWSKETEYYLQRAVAYGEADFSLDEATNRYKEKFYMCTDSAAAATAMATGRKTEAGNISWDYGGKDGFAFGKSDKDGDPENAPFTTICEMLKDQKGGFFGTVSTVPYNHATPAAFISHNPDRNNYYQGRRDWYDGPGLAESIFYDVKPDVVIGGGFPSELGADGSDFSGYISKELYGKIVNNKTDDYVMAGPQIAGEGFSAPHYSTIENAVADINNVNSERHQKKLVALYSSGNWDGPYATSNGTFTRHSDGSFVMNSTDPLTESDPMEDGIPNLEHASIQAIKLLLYRSALNADKPFFLMVEQGDIDWANHENDYKWMVGTTWELSKTVDAICRYIDGDDKGENANATNTGDRMNWQNTLLIVTSDHGNSYMRLKRDESGAILLGKGELPTQTPTDAGTGGGQYPFKGNFSYSDEVSYGSDYHTNELVMVYAKGAATSILGSYQGTWYPKTNIIDNTQLFKAMAAALNLDISK